MSADDVHTLELHWDPHVRVWFIRFGGTSSQVTASEIILDAPAVSFGRGFRARGILRGSGVRALEGRHVAVDVARVVRGKPRPGTPPKVDPQVDWRILFDENSGHWVCYRSNQQDVAVEAAGLTVDAYCESRHGVLYSRCEMLLNGRTNTDAKWPFAKNLHLRELREYPQEMTINLRVKPTLGGRDGG